MQRGLKVFLAPLERRALKGPQEQPAQLGPLDRLVKLGYKVLSVLLA